MVHLEMANDKLNIGGGGGLVLVGILVVTGIVKGCGLSLELFRVGIAMGPSCFVSKVLCLKVTC